MHQRVEINGQNTVTGAGSVSTPGGILAQPTNIGTYERDVNVWAPEANIKLAYSFTDRLSVSVGYTFLYWTRVALAANQVDLNINETQFNGGLLAGPATPTFAWDDTDFWVQTVDIGFNLNY
jgi:long-subunit fatty acid transport protein